MNAKIRNKISKAITNFMLGKSHQGWFNDIPLSEIDVILRLFGFRLVNEDLTDLECLLCGRDGRAFFGICPINEDSLCKYGLNVTWYKSDNKSSYPYDVVAYLT